MDYKEINVKEIKEGIINFAEFGQNLNLRSDNVDNLKTFYNEIFNYMLKEKVCIKFLLSDDLMSDEIDKEIANVLFDSLNSEMESSKKNMEHIIENQKKINELKV